MNSTSLYAAIDLGSNSFHMLVVREAAGSIQTLTRIKRKVRLAAGLNNDNHLSAEAMERGWQCLRLFAERLQDIPQPQIRVVATATLRLAVNAGEFIAKAQTILGCPVQVISGEEEARLILAIVIWRKKILMTRRKPRAMYCVRSPMNCVFMAGRSAWVPPAPYRHCRKS